MTREETGTVMDILTAAYPQFYRGQNDDERMNALNLWSGIFADDDVQIVCAALKALIVSDEKGYPPHIGAVKAKIRLITQGDQMTEAEAWMLIKRAISRGIHDSREEFDKLPPVLQQLVGDPRQLYDWALMDVDHVETVVASNLMRSYRAKVQHENEIAALPSDVAKLVSGVVGGMALDDGSDRRLLNG